MGQREKTTRTAPRCCGSLRAGRVGVTRVLAFPPNSNEQVTSSRSSAELLQAGTRAHRLLQLQGTEQARHSALWFKQACLTVLLTMWQGALAIKLTQPNPRLLYVLNLSNPAHTIASCCCIQSEYVPTPKVINCTDIDANIRKASFRKSCAFSTWHPASGKQRCSS